jgi:hypothetical protein
MGLLMSPDVDQTSLLRPAATYLTYSHMTKNDIWLENASDI